MLRPADLLISSVLLFSVGLLTLLGAARWGTDTGPNEDAIAVAQTVHETPTVTASATPSSPNQISGPASPTVEAPVFLSNPREPTADPTVSATQEPECRYWNVLSPVDESLSSFWIGGWVKECDGVMGPVVELRADESIEEVYLRLENAVAQIKRLEKMLEAASATPVIE